MSPWPALPVLQVAPVQAALPLVVCRVTLLAARALVRVAPLMSPPLAAMVRSLGSISQVPAWPWGAAVVRVAPSAT